MNQLTPTPDSSQLAAFGYDPASQTLAVQFRSTPAKVYHYKAVPPEVGAAMERAESKGSFLAKNVKAVYDFEAIDAEPADSAEAG